MQSPQVHHTAHRSPLVWIGRPMAVLAGGLLALLALVIFSSEFCAETAVFVTAIALMLAATLSGGAIGGWRGAGVAIGGPLVILIIMGFLAAPIGNPTGFALFVGGVLAVSAIQFLIQRQMPRVSMMLNGAALAFTFGVLSLAALHIDSVSYITVTAVLLLSGTTGMLVGMHIVPLPPETATARWRASMLRHPFARPEPAHVIEDLDQLLRVLPERAAGHVRTVLDKLRLWKGERAQIARELVAHFADGIDAGKTEGELIEDFGDPETTAKLLSSSKKKTRGPLWQAWSWIWKGALVMVAAFILFYGVLAMKYFIASPNPSTDYLAPLQASIADRINGDPTWDDWIAVWEDRPAYPIREPADEGEQAEPVNAHPFDLTPSVNEEIEAASGWLDEVRSLASRGAGFGWPHTIGGHPEPYKQMLIARDGATPEDLEWWPSGDILEESLIGILLPYLSEQRNTAKWLALDAVYAATQNDPQRVIADVRAMDAIAQEAGEFPVLINSLVETAIKGLLLAVIRDTLATNPDLFTKEQITTLAHILARPGFINEPHLEGERAFVYDTVQRIYSDDGTGDGHMTNEGARALFELEGFSGSDPANPSAVFSAIIGPATVALVASRKETVAEYERHIDALLEWSRNEPWERGPSPSYSFEFDDTLYKMRYPLVHILLPALESVYWTMDRFEMSRDSMLVALAAASYRIDTGAWPESLDELVPQLLPRVPLDPYTGDPIGYRLRDDGPVIYSVGPDGDDDQGRRFEGSDTLRKVVVRLNTEKEGDYTLFNLGRVVPVDSE